MKVLLVDDTSWFADSVKGALETRGYEVIVAGSYGEVLTELGQHDFDAVVTDFDLGYLSTGHGPEVVKEAKAAGVPVMLWSGLTRPDTGADLQTTKDDIDKLFSFLKEYDNGN